MQEVYQLNIKKLVLDISFFKNSFLDFPKGGKFKFELDKFKLNKEILIEKIFTITVIFFKYFLRFLPKFFFNIFLLKINENKK